MNTDFIEKFLQFQNKFCQFHREISTLYENLSIPMRMKYYNLYDKIMLFLNFYNLPELILIVYPCVKILKYVILM